MKKQFFYGLGIMAFAFIASSAIADPKADIAAYSKAFEAGDNENGNILLKKAFEDAKANLKSDNPYLVKIAYDFALNAVQNDEAEQAIPAGKIVKTAIENNNEIFKNSDLDEILLINSIIDVYPLKNNRNDYKNFNKLSEHIDTFSAKHPNDPLLLNAYTAYLNALREAWRWGRLGRESEKLISLVELHEKQGKLNNEKYKMLGLFYRGQAKFVLGVSHEKIEGMTSLKSFENAPYWESAIADILSAEEIYGPPKSIDDKNYAAMAIWEDLTWAGAIYESAELRKKAEDNIKLQVKIDNQEEKDFFDKKKCESLIKTNLSGSELKKLSYKYNFAAVRILYDLDWQNKPTNIRVLASIPQDDVAEAARIDTKMARPTVLPDTPKDCRKDIAISIRFVVR